MRSSRVTTAMVSMAVCLMAAGCSNEGPAQGGGSSDPAAAPSSSSKPDEEAVEDSVCGLTEDSLDLPAVKPEDLEVSAWREVMLPTSKVHGPGEASSTERSCFAHSPEGAALAAINLAAQMDSPEAVRRIMSDGPIRDQVAENVQSMPPGTAAVVGTPVGFTVEKFDARSAEVTWAVRQSPNTWRMATSLMVWSDGDWKVDGQTPLDQRPDSKVVQSLDDQGELVMIDDAG